MEEYFKSVGDVRRLIETISSQSEEVERRHAVILSSTSQNKKQKDELQRLNNETNRNANAVRAKLKEMQDKPLAGGHNHTESVIQRIQSNQHSHLTRWFSDVMRNYHKAQIDFRDKCKAQIQRQLEIVEKVTTDEELEEMLNCEKLSIFIADINSDAHTCRQALSEIESRHLDIISLESSIRELHEGELINSIEKNVMSAAEYVDQSKSETQKAVDYKKNRYKIASMPNFLKSFRKPTVVKAPEEQLTADLNHNQASQASDK
ncbi:syntaxin-2-like isoform X2 [Synchiropus splendidus]|uniref:syntaxin-2-like isoform X2 n=1 Tax=Synchiropus splendidus TaxID=270530 RepID=UPI00237D7C99|nr:syntaxin-2-like isoform X2 [Synchiropus splendidus]